MGTGKATAVENFTNENRVAVGNEINIAVQTTNEEEDPIAAWGDGRYLVVWQSTRNGPTRIYGTQLTGDGQIISSPARPDDFPVSASPADQLFAALAWSGKNYLVVWQDLRSRKNWEIYGARIDATGQRLDQEDIPIGIGAGNRRHPVLAWNGKIFLAVWMEERPDSGWDIVGRRIASDGKPLDPQEINISAVAGDQTSPAIAWNGNSFFVVWMNDRKDSSQDIYGARVDASGKLLDPKGIIIAAAPHEQAYPALARVSTELIVVWVDRRNSNQYLLYGARVDQKGNVLDLNGVPLSTTPHLHMFPDISCRKKDCLVIWEEEVPSGKAVTGIQDIIRDVYAMRLDISGKNLSAASNTPIRISPGAPGNHFSRVSTDGNRYLTVWKDYRSGLAASFGRIIDIQEAP